MRAKQFAEKLGFGWQRFKRCDEPGFCIRARLRILYQGTTQDLYQGTTLVVP
jgi:hypothetical protein